MLKNIIFHKVFTIIKKKKFHKTFNMSDCALLFDKTDLSMYGQIAFCVNILIS